MVITRSKSSQGPRAPAASDDSQLTMPGPPSKPKQHAPAKGRNPTPPLVGLSHAAANKKASNSNLQQTATLGDVKVKKEESPGLVDEFKSHAIKTQELVDEKMIKPLKHVRQKQKKSFSLRSFFVKVALLYVGLAYFLICPSDPTRSPMTCSYLASTHQSLAPHVSHSLHIANGKLKPILQPIEPYLNQVRPVFARTSATVAPILKNAKLGYYHYVHPRFMDAMTGARRASSPYAEKYAEMVKALHAQKVAPHLDFATDIARQGYESAHKTIRPVFDVVAPPTIKFWTERGRPASSATYAWSSRHFKETIKPGTATALAWSHKTYIGTVQPNLIRVVQWVLEGIKSRVIPTLKRAYSLYVNPQVERVLHKFNAYRVSQIGKESLQEAKKHQVEVAKDHGIDDVDDFIETLKDDHDKPVISDTDVVKSTPRRTEEETEAKRVATEAMRVQYQADIDASVVKQRELFTKQMSDLRTAMSSDALNRFAGKIGQLERDSDQLVSRLEKYYTRSAQSTSRSVEERVDEAELISEKASKRVAREIQEAKEEVNQYGRDHFQRETAVIAQADDVIEDLVGEAQSKIGAELTWLDGVGYEDWQRYHNLREAKDKLTAEMNAMQQASPGTKNPIAHSEIYETLDNLKLDMDKIQQSFETRLSKVSTTGIKVLKGQPLGVVDAANKAAAGVSAKVGGAYDAAAAGVAAAGQGVKSVINLENAKDTTGAVKSIAAAAVQSASSLAAEASKSVVNAAGGTPAPTGAQEHISSALGVGKEAIASLTDQAHDALSPAYNQVGSVAEKVKAAAGGASQAAFSAVGATPSPTDASQTMASFFAKATDSVTDVISEAKESAESIQAAWADSVHSATRAAKIAAGQTPPAADAQEAIENAKLQAGSVYAGLADSAGKAFGDAIAAAGGTPSPTDIKQSVASVVAQASRAVDDTVQSASSVGANVHSAISSSCGEVIDGVTRACQHIIGEASQTLIKAVGGTPQPTDASQTLESLLNKVKPTDLPAVTDLLASATDFAQSLGGQLSQNVASVVKPSGSSSQGGIGVDKVAQAAKDAAEEAVRRAGEAADAIRRRVDEF